MKIIEPKEHYSQKVLLDPVLELIKVNPILRQSFQNHKNATFILYSDELKGIYGGALLLKQPFSFLHKKIQKSIVNFGLKTEEVWTCAIFLCTENNCFSRHFEFFFETFYRNLYKKLVEFGLKEKTDFLYMMLEPGEHLCTEALGCWPYILEVKSHESLNGLFHGVLSLALNPSKTHVKTGQAMFSAEIKLAA